MEARTRPSGQQAEGRRAPEALAPEGTPREDSVTWVRGAHLVAQVLPALEEAVRGALLDSWIAIKPAPTAKPTSRWTRGTAAIAATTAPSWTFRRAKASEAGSAYQVFAMRFAKKRLTLGAEAAASFPSSRRS